MLIVRNFGLAFYEANIRYPETYKEQKVYALRGSSLLPFVLGKTDEIHSPTYVFAIEKGLKNVDFGAVINYTKKKMINKSKDMSYFIYSKYSIIQKTFNVLLKLTKIQGNEQIKFRHNDVSNV